MHCEHIGGGLPKSLSRSLIKQQIYHQKKSLGVHWTPKNLERVKYNTMHNFASVSSFTAYIIFPFMVRVNVRVKDHRQRIPKNCYKTIFGKINTEEIFFQLTLITNKEYFSRKKLFCENLLLRYMWFISMVVTSLVGANTGVWCQWWMLLVNIVYLLVKVSNTPYILS